MTEAEYLDWLEDDQARRTVLLEIDSNPVRLLAVMPYSSLPTDTNPNVTYDAVVQGGVQYRENLALDGTARASYSAITLSNEDGQMDGWVYEVWRNRAIRIYWGDVTWGRDDFRLVASGTVSEVGVSRDTIKITLVDSAERLDAAISDQLVGGTGQEAENLMPQTFGECHNVTPVLFAAGQHEYRFHGEAAERVIEVRDNGVVAGHTVVTGGFRLTATPAGTITASVQGSVKGGTYQNRVGPLVRMLATAYGPEANRFLPSEIDESNFTAFDVAHQQPVGIYVKERMTVIQAIVTLAASVGAQPVMSRTGQLRLIKVAIPSEADTDIYPGDYEHDSLEIDNQTEVLAAVRIAFCRQWTPGQFIAEGVPTAHRDLYEQEWLTAVARAPGVAEAYRIDQDGDEIETSLLRRVDAQAEAARRLALWSVPRTVFKFRGYPKATTLALGQPIRLFGDRFGLQTGKVGQIIGLTVDWVLGYCDVEVLI